MRLVPAPQYKEQVLADLRAEMEMDRPAGIHVTDLLYCLTKSYLKATFKMEPNEQETMLFSIGLGLESVVLKKFQRVAPIQVDGIWMSLDFFPYADKIGEFKSTRISSGPTKEGGELVDRLLDTGMWRGQIMAYMWGAQLTSCLLVVLHLMGNYRPPFPELTTWLVEAEMDELVKHWQYILGRKVVLEEALETKVAPMPYLWNEKWECDVPCRFKLLCETGAV